ncbi:hypothetical protein HK100_003994 [Physocladia obscura]|uniref:Glycosyltransferase n=1 Tax=Physocladia obscura TaxID=109957 RepID=A0AAD5SWB0_9FUNG|nr:hypothetical protein HK100_003994 [Physocladia obscura]
MSAATNPKTILFLSNLHDGQLNPLLHIANAITHSQPSTKIVVVASELHANRIAETLPTAVFCPLQTAPDSVLARVKAGTFTAKEVEGPAGSVVTIAKNITSIMPSPDIYAAEYNAVTATIETYAPDVAVVDFVFFAGRNAVANKQIPFFCNVAFAPLNVIREQTWTATWNNPSSATGFGVDMTFLQKLYNIWFIVAQSAVGVVHFANLAYRVGKVGIKFYDLSHRAIRRDARGIFINTVSEFEYPFPPSENVIETGPLVSSFDEKDYDTWLDGHETVVFIGFGSVTKLDTNTVQKFLSVFETVTQKYPSCAFLFKVGHTVDDIDENVIKSAPENVRIVGFLQSQLATLNHPHVKVFASHCGGNGVHEGLYFGKPILGVPRWSDCYDFAQRVQDFGVGLRVNKAIPTIEVEEVEAKMLRLLIEPQFTKNATEMMKKMRKSGVQIAVDAIMKN